MILLIVPEGIEISVAAMKRCFPDALLIVPEGIEMNLKQPCGGG